MEKYLKSIGARVLSPILCTVTSIGLAISIFATVFYAGMGGVDYFYQHVYEEIADGYAMYAIDLVEDGEIAELEEYLLKKGIACSITKSLVDENKIEVEGSAQTAFVCGEIKEDAAYQLDILEGAERQYHTESLVAVLFGYNYYISHGDTVTADVQRIVFDRETGYFYYETPGKFFKVEDIAVYQEGGYIDYSLTKIDGQECYYNGFYKLKLNTAEYELWDEVRIGNYKMPLATEDRFINTILVVTTNEILEKGVGTHIVWASSDVIEFYPDDYIGVYTIQMNWDKSLAEDESLFSEWDELYGKLMGFENHVVPSIILSFIGFIIGLVLLIYSTVGEKENLGLLHKAPVAIYSGTLFFVEVLLFMLLLEGIPEILVSYGRGSVDLGITLVLMDVGVMVYIAFIWFQNIVTRLKCKSFWRTTEVYYVYKYTKKSWSIITKPLKWCWEKITIPCRAIGCVCKDFLHQVSTNTPLLVGGLVVFGVITLIECFVAFNLWWYDLEAVFLLIKAVEALALFIILFHMKELHEGGKRVASGDMSQPIDTSRMYWKFREHGENINKVSDGIALAVEERMKSEHFKTELITNVSHDIKTPLTSIINYVDLIKKEEIADEKVQEYVDVLDRQSARLKKLIEDLMEASKASTGNLAVNLEECDVEVLLTQVIGEFEERLEKNQLKVVVEKPDYPVKMMADGRHMWRVLDNLLNNACKYSLSGTRVYVSLKQEKNEAVIVFKNISKEALNIPSDELMERFVRGDSSRNTEGSGLGLSIAQSLTELMRGSMKLDIDGDLFKVTLRFPAITLK